MAETIPVPAAPATQVPVPNSPTPTPAPPAPDQPAPGVSSPSDAPAAPTEPTAPAKPDDTKDSKPKGRWEQRVDQLTAQKHALQAQNMFLQRQLEDLSRPLAYPDTGDFDATETHRLRSVMREERRADVAHQAQTVQYQAAAVRQQTFETKLEAARERIPDIDAVKSSFYHLPMSDAACDVLAESDRAAEITAHLVRNPAEAQRIATLAPQWQAVEIARIEGRLSSAAQVPVRRVSQAPEPPPTIGGGVPATARSPDDMSVTQLQQLLYRKR